jgi:hypothetical protein
MEKGINDEGTRRASKESTTQSTSAALPPHSAERLSLSDASSFSFEAAPQREAQPPVILET